MNWKITFFVFVGVILVGLVFLQYTPKEKQLTGGKWVTFYSQIDNDTTTFYKGYVKKEGASDFNLVAICSEIEDRCRNPTKEEIKQDRYIPQG